jgi:TP901 family phage tail tape measure protein
MAFSAAFIYQITDKYSDKIRTMRRVTDEFRLRMAVTGEGMVKLGGKIGKLSTRLANLRTGFLAMATTRALKSTIEESIAFERALNKVAAVTQASSSEMLTLAKNARKLGLETKFSATQAAEGMVMLGQRGFDVTKILQTLPDVLTMATAGDLELAEASKMVTGTMYAFELGTENAARIADVYAITAAKTASTMNDLNAAMINAAPLAHAAGLSFEEVAALVGIMSNKNIMGSKSGTLLMNAFRNIVKPTREAIDTLKKFKFRKDEWTDETGKIVDFVKVLELFQERGIGIAEIFKIFQVRGAKGTAALMGQTEAIRALLKQYELQEITAKRMAAVMQSGIIGTATEAKSSWEGMKEAIGKGLEPITIGVLEAVTAMNRFIARHPAFAKTLGIVLVVIAVVLTIVTLVGVVLAAIAGLITVIGIIGGAAIGAGAVIIGIIAGVIAIVVMLINIVKNIIEISKMFFIIWLDGTKKFLGQIRLVGKVLKYMLLNPIDSALSAWNTLKGFFGKGSKHELSSTMISPDSLSTSNVITVNSVIKGSIDINDRTGGRASIATGGGDVPLNVNTDAGYSMQGY